MSSYDYDNTDDEGGLLISVFTEVAVSHLEINLAVSHLEINISH